jgi:hypothetical protein
MKKYTENGAFLAVRRAANGPTSDESYYRELVCCRAAFHIRKCVPECNYVQQASTAICCVPDNLMKSS